MRITFLNQKGGVGKTTLVLMLAGVLRQAGYDVAIDDRDPQGSARLCAPDVHVPLYDPAAPARYVVTDTAGNLQLDGQLGGDLAGLVAASDRLVLVTDKSRPALHASVPMVKFIKAHKRADATACVLFNRIRAGTTIGSQDGAAIAADLGLPALSVELPLAAAFENASILGMAAVTGKRHNDLLLLAMEIMK